MTQEREITPFQESLFDGYRFYDVEQNERYAPLLITALPVIDDCNHIPPIPLAHWKADGIPFAARSGTEVLTSLTGLDETDLTTDVLEQTFSTLRDEARFGKAGSLAWFALQDGFEPEEVWNERSQQMALRKVNLGLREATALLGARYDEEVGSIQYLSDFKPKDFWRIFSLLETLRQDEVEGLEPYFAFAEELHMSLLLHYPDLSNYNHQMHKHYGSEYSLHVSEMYGRIKQKDPNWLEMAAGMFGQRIATELNKPWYGRAATLISAARFADLLPQQFVREQFMRKYDQLKLNEELEEYLVQLDSMFVTNAEIPLANIKYLADSLAWADPDLRTELGMIMARREIEVVQHILEAQQSPNPRLIHLLQQHKLEAAKDLPQNSAERAELLRTGVEEEVEGIRNGSVRYGAAGLDRKLESWLFHSHDGRLDEDELAIGIDVAQEYVLTELREKGFDFDTVELLLGFISPLCRLDEETVERYAALSFRRSVIDAFEAFKEDNPKAAQTYAGYLSEFEQHPQILFNHWWDEQEEYYT